MIHFATTLLIVGAAAVTVREAETAGEPTWDDSAYA